MDYKKHLQVMKRQRRLQAREETPLPPSLKEIKLSIAAK
jgi:hypothetical protein